MLVYSKLSKFILDDAGSNSGTKFEIGSGTKLSNEVDGKNVEEQAIASGGQSLSRSVMNQNNIDESEDLRPKILLMGLRRYAKSIWKSVLHYLKNKRITNHANYHLFAL